MDGALVAGLDRLIDMALREDLGPGDITTESIVPETLWARAEFIAKEEGVVAGLPVAGRVFRRLDPETEFRAEVAEGSAVKAGAVLAVVAGRARTILTGERVALNFVRHLSGIATRTRRLVAAVEGLRAVVLDTRKITPGLRALEKYAVRAGGGRNHRFGLFDGILIKDNHIRAAGGIREAVARARARAPHTLKVEVEVQSLDEVEEALAAGADIIMLDNMPVAAMREAVRCIGGRALVEASGGITEENVREVAATGVDFISAGALTHSARALDISLEIVEVR
ncbi:carboxylating nicotinate-nucleotide diphosphorylase [Thermodesulfitimonas autotrophica]|uniref:carboxylating nicotinate-nucleotide diphosphorylase n=1 Tax=Thermodesulfitimonas autotrophica TaxID=1894989 RepID=UPI002FE228F1